MAVGRTDLMKVLDNATHTERKVHLAGRFDGGRVALAGPGREDLDGGHTDWYSGLFRFSCFMAAGRQRNQQKSPSNTPRAVKPGEPLRLRVFVVNPDSDPPRRREDTKNREAAE